jgi:hypothetical protein
MAASKEWFEYHLTPRGWEIGSHKVDVANEVTKALPTDRVLTVLHREYRSSSFRALAKLI